MKRSLFRGLDGGAEVDFHTDEFGAPAGAGECEIQVRYHAGTSGVETTFTCNDIETAFTDSTLTTIAGGAMGPGTMTIDGCAVVE